MIRFYHKICSSWIISAFVLIILIFKGRVECSTVYWSSEKNEIDLENMESEEQVNLTETEKQESEESFENDDQYWKWKIGHIPYEISIEVSKKLRPVIEDAIGTWNGDFSNCIPWLPRKKETDYVSFESGEMCHSEVGRMAGKQLIVLDEDNCDNRGSVLHEMVHSIGFTHEHNRPDRDDYIEILFLNIPLEWRRQYGKEPPCVIHKLGPYDYYSLMHYKMQSPDRKKPAFKVLKENVDESRIGQTVSLSEIDKSKIKKLYCPSN